MMNTYLFDFDGTLVDSMPIYVSTMLRILDDYGVSYGDDVIKTITPMGMEGTAKYYIKLGVPLTVDQILARMGVGMLDAYQNRIPAKEHVISALHSLKTAGASLNVLTASPHITLDACLERLGIDLLFDNIWSCDDFATSKSDPEIYRMAAKKLGKNPEEILFLDDNLGAVKTAKSAGMKVCGVYDPSAEEYIDEMKQECDYYIENFSQIPT